MKIIPQFVLTSVLMLLAGSQIAFGHGFVLSLDGNQIAATSQVPTISPHLFVGSLDQFSATVFFADHGGVEAGSGFTVPGDTFGVAFLGRLWYSDGGIAQPAASSVSLNATSYDAFGAVLGQPVNLAGASLNPGALPVVGNDTHSIGWILSGNELMPGAYGVAYRVTGFDSGTSAFVPSVPLVIAFNTPGFLGDGLSNARQAVFNAALQGDFNRDGKLDGADVQPMMTALADLNEYQVGHDVPSADLLAIGDIDRNEAVSNADLQALLVGLTILGVPPQSVPEPSAAFLFICAIGFARLAFQFRTIRDPIAVSD